MAETSRTIENKWLLLIAVILAVIVVFIYNAHIRAIRAEQQGQTITVVELQTDLQAGDRIEARDIRAAEIPRGNEEAFGKVVRWSDRDTILVRGGKAVNQPVMKGQYLLWDYIGGFGRNRASGKLADGMVARVIEFDSDESLGDILSVGDTVNLLGTFSLKGQPYQTYRIISGVPVLNVGGAGAAEQASPTARRSYRKITVQVTPAVSVMLSNLMTHMAGTVQLELNRPGESPANAGQINPELMGLARQARTGQGSSRQPIRTAPPGATP